MVKPNFLATPVETVRLLPIYIVCDTSHSMGTSGAMDAVNEGLTGVVREINRQGQKGDDIRLGVITYATKANVALPLTSVNMKTAVPPLQSGGVTNLPQAFELLSATLSTDYHALRDAGHRAYRPAVFIFTDGRPTDEQGNELKDNSSWLTPLETLKAHPIWAPRIYAYGFGDALETQLRLMVSERTVSDEQANGRVIFTGADAAESIGRLFPHLFSTITSAAGAAANGATEEQIGKAFDEAHAKPQLDEIDPDDWWGGR